jgi:mycofactocin precursor
MQQDTRADAAPSTAPSCATGVADALSPDPGADREPGIDDLGITGELLVEEVSIDGMCGVY